MVALYSNGRNIFSPNSIKATMTVYHKPSKATKGCACNEKKKLVALYGNASGFPIQSLQEKMEKQSFNTINPENIAYVPTRMLPSAKNLGGIANFIQGAEAKFSITQTRAHRKIDSNTHINKNNELKAENKEKYIKAKAEALKKRMKALRNRQENILQRVGAIERQNPVNVGASSSGTTPVSKRTRSSQQKLDEFINP